ncbi:MAG: hypothetical protein IKO35_00630 [Elusimicrobiaceae bacterium]|nr:hypothetical protein [Elusimicrobiaceae bacterium]
MHLLKLYFDYMREPEKALQSFLQQPSFTQACAGYFVAALGWVLFFNTASGGTFPVLLLKLFFVFLAELTVGFVLAAFCGLFLDFLRIETSPAKLFALIGSSGIIKGLLIAFALIAAAVPEARLKVLAPFALLLVFLLQLGYLVRSLKRVYGVSYWKALGAWLFTGVPVLAVFGLLAVFTVWGIILVF